MSKNTSSDLKILHVIRINKTNITKKSESILTIFEQFTELLNFGIICRFSPLFVYLFHKMFNFQFRILKLNYNQNHFSILSG